MHKPKPNYEYEVEDELNPDLSNIDPRAFMEAYIYLWRNNNEDLTYPLMTGNMIIPVRFLEFNLANSRLLPIGGEQCVRFQVSLWEADPVYYTKKKPDYRGRISTYYNNLLPPLDTIYKQLMMTRTKSNSIKREINNIDRMGTLK